MKILILVSLLSISLFAKDTYYFAPLGLEKAESNIQQYESLIKYLRKETGLNIEVRYFPSYDELLEAFRDGRADFSHFGPLPYISLSSTYSFVEPVVGFKDNQHRKGYKCCIIAKKDSGFADTKKLKSVKKVALTQPLSTCGYLMTSEILEKHGVDLKKLEYKYVGSHSNSALSVILGESDIGGIKCDIAKRYLFHDIVIVDRSKTVPEFAFVVNTKTVDEKTKNTLKNALLNINNLDKDALKTWGDQTNNGVFESKDSDYSYLREVVEKTEIPEVSR